ncbi:MAG: ATPase, T2SS/T4P/T4SS family [Candidatus Omnitrophota bacterium]
MTYYKLGEILIKQGLITEAQLHKAIETQKQEKGRIGEILVKLGFVTEEDIAAALGTQLGIPYSSDKSNLLTPKDDQDLEKLVPQDFAQQHYVLPLSKNMSLLTCAVFDPLDLMMLDNLKKITGCEINPVIATKSVILKGISNFYTKSTAISGDGKSSLLGEAVQSTYTPGENTNFGKEIKSSSDSTELSIDKLIAKAGEAPVIKLVDLMIRQAIDERASDIHIEPYKEKINLRYRIDGVLYQIPPPSHHMHLAIVSRIKILAKLDIAEKRLPQDGNITAKLEDRTVDLRVSTIPTVWGEKVVMRILDKAATPLNLTNLGFDTQQLEVIRKSLHAPYGLIFVTGPTGSGKSTTLYSCLNEIIDPKKNILTAENPVEYKLDGINQVGMRQEIGLTFATTLRAFLRQDPDIIMVGEVRDLETAQICVRAALTGHLVLSTLHTNDAASAINRLMDIGIESFLLTPSLIIIIAQRLARRLCNACKEAYEPDPGQLGGLKLKSELIYRSKGCEKCNFTGYRGRLTIAEVMPIDEKIRNLISQKASYSELVDMARKNGMNTLFEDGLRKVEEGITSLDEVLSVAVSRE